MRGPLRARETTDCWRTGYRIWGNRNRTLVSRCAGHLSCQYSGAGQDRSASEFSEQKLGRRTVFGTEMHVVCYVTQLGHQERTRVLPCCTSRGVRNGLGALAVGIPEEPVNESTTIPHFVLVCHHRGRAAGMACARPRSAIEDGHQVRGSSRRRRHLHRPGRHDRLAGHRRWRGGDRQSVPRHGGGMRRGAQDHGRAAESTS